jgi:transglutaminase-like putative cysteine protease
MNKGLLNLEEAIATVDLIDPYNIEWQRVQRIGYLIHQDMRYEYPGPIHDLDQRLMLLPPEHYGNQHLIDYRLNVSTAQHTLTCQLDDFGNQEIKLFIPHIEQAVDFEAWILIERYAEENTHYTSAHWLTDNRLLEPTRLTQPDEHLRHIATTLLATSKQCLALAAEINQWTHQALQYAHDVTNIHTTASQALALGQGVCQDYTHIMLSLCHLCGLPARYVSGHMLGEGGTHAWVEVLLPVPEKPDVALVIPFDPTNGKLVDLHYLSIAVGRDYYDIAPTSGTFRAAYQGQLITSKRVDLTVLQYLDTNEERNPENAA